MSDYTEAIRERLEKATPLCLGNIGNREDLKPLCEWVETAKIDLAHLLAERDVLREALKTIEPYVSHNGDDWVQKIARKALAWKPGEEK